MSEPSSPAETVDRFLGAVASGDLDSVRRMYHPDAVIWHSNDGLEQSIDQNLAVLSWITDNLGGLRYAGVRRREFAGGVVEQHDTIVAVPGRDEPLVMPACLVVLVDSDGRITRVDEYIDSAAVSALLAAVSTGR